MFDEGPSSKEGGMEDAMVKEVRDPLRVQEM